MTKLFRSALLAAALGLLACGGPARPPAARPSGPAPAAAKTSVASAEPTKPAAEWVYSSAGKRDPFKSFLSDGDAARQGVATRCATPLGKFEIEQLKLVAVVTGLDDPVAMVEAPNGVGYHLRRGACVGRNGGVVSAVRTGEVVISEWVIRADGSRDKAQTVIRLPKEASLKIEE